MARRMAASPLRHAGALVFKGFGPAGVSQERRRAPATHSSGSWNTQGAAKRSSCSRRRVARLSRNGCHCFRGLRSVGPSPRLPTNAAFRGSLHLLPAAPDDRSQACSEEDGPPLPVPLLRKYISYARQFVKPTIGPEAREVSPSPTARHWHCSALPPSTSWFPALFKAEEDLVGGAGRHVSRRYRERGRESGAGGCQRVQ